MARSKAKAPEAPVVDDLGYRETRYATIGREVDVARANLEALEARQAQYAPQD